MSCVDWYCQDKFVDIGVKWVVDSDEDLSCEIEYCPFCGSKLDWKGCTEGRDEE